MKSNELLEEIKNNLSEIKVKTPDKENLDEINYKISNYNYITYNEIFNKNLEKIENIDETKLDDLKNKIEDYFKKYPIKDKKFIVFTKYICVYLSFISKKPFHPEGLKFSDNSSVFKKNNKYICSLKDKNSLCKYCVAIDL